MSSHDEFLTIQHMVQAPQDRYVNRLRWLERSQNGETQLCSETGGVMRTVPLFPGSPEPSLDGPKAMKCLDESNFMEWSTSFRHYGRGMGQGQTSPAAGVPGVPSHHLSELCGRMWLIAISILLLRHGTRTMVLPCASFLSLVFGDDKAICH